MTSKLGLASITIHEHDLSRGAKRTVSIDPFGGLITEGNFSVRIDEADANTTYIGVAQIGSSESATVWQIKKIVVSGTVTSILYAGGDDGFNNSWTDRSSLIYS